MIHAVPVRFLIQSKDQADRLFRFIATGFQSFHPIKRSYHRTFIISRSTTTDPAVLYLSAIRIEAPSVALRDYVQMSYHAHDPFSFSCKVDVSAVVIRIVHCKALFAGHVQHGVIGFLDVLAKRVLPWSFNGYTGDLQ